MAESVSLNAWFVFRVLFAIFHWYEAILSHLICILLTKYLSFKCTLPSLLIFSFIFYSLKVCRAHLFWGGANQWFCPSTLLFCLKTLSYWVRVVRGTFFYFFSRDSWCFSGGGEVYSLKVIYDLQFECRSFNVVSAVLKKIFL